MASSSRIVTTRQTAFLHAHHFDPDRVLPHFGVGYDGITVIMLPGDASIADGRINHPWAAQATVIAFSDSFLRVELPYPDPKTRAAAIAARDGDWEESVGPEAAATWRKLAN